MTSFLNPASKIAFADLRLRKHADYQRAYNASRKQHAKELTWFCARRDAMPVRSLHPNELLHGTPYAGPRIGLTVGKVMGKAHDRNRIKRRMRAAVAQHAGLLAGLEIDVILHPRRSVLLLDWDKLQREVANVFRAVRKQCSAPKAAVTPAQFSPVEIERR
ncbi:ribonuclease P protein component [Terriglobus roseus]|uniref:Ribonuclease P protein component n=1 Tax=Terriglobus roseus TaxID=392734 RepID=A0A1H4NCW2_9BACT|nr:ribonuclease P protein component [Terriglobus roseus]SEB93083.1 ribonuclease P protein component [Terriglobus roseus]